MTPTFQKQALFTISVTLATVLLLLLAWQIKDVLLVAFAGFIVAVFLSGCALAVHRVTRLPRSWSLLVAVLVLLGIAALVGVLLLPAVVNQVNELLSEAPRLLANLRTNIERTAWGRSLLSNAPEGPDVAGQLGTLLTGLASTLSITVNTIAMALLALTVGVFFAAQPRLYRRGLLLVVPRKFEARARTLLDEVTLTLQAWLIGQAIAMSAVAVLTTVGFYLAGVPLPLALGIIAGLLDIIPIVGPLLAAIPAVLVGLTAGWLPAIWAAGVSLVVQQIESNLIQPLVQRRAVKIPPALLLLTLIVMGRLFGFLGILVAAPFVAVILLLFKHLYVEGVLDKEVTTPDKPPDDPPPLPV